MTYKQMRRWNKQHPTGGKRQFMGFDTLGPNKRRRTPWLGGTWYEPGKEEERAEFIRQWELETERLLKRIPGW